MAKTFTVTIEDSTWAAVQEHLTEIHTQHDEATMTDARMETYLSDVTESKLGARVLKAKLRALRDG